MSDDLQIHMGQVTATATTQSNAPPQSNHLLSATTGPVEFSTIPPHRAQPTPNPLQADTSITSRVLETTWRQIKSWLGSSDKRKKGSMWEMPVYVSIVVGNKEVNRTAVVLFDPQCMVDVVSTHFLLNFPGLDYKRSNENIGYSITGLEPYQSIGIVDLRWYGQKPRAHSLNKVPQFRPRFEESSCCVVDSKEFELLIGRNTIDRLHLFKPNNRIIAAFRGSISHAEAKEVRKDQQKADGQREQARKDKKQREEQKKEEEEQRSKNEAA